MHPHTRNNHSTKTCIVIKKNLENCMQKATGNEKCSFYKKVLKMCKERKKKIFLSGP